MKIVDRALESKYKGNLFVFHSPFENTPGWKDGDVGVLKKLYAHDPLLDPCDSVRDLWVGVNVEDGEEHDLWGGEAYDLDGKPIVREHMFTNWSPR